MDPSKVTLVMFDVFNTVVAMYGTLRSETDAYLEHIKKRPWSPLLLPSNWGLLPAYHDAIEGIWRINTKRMCVTCSNGNIDVLQAIIMGNELRMHLVPLEEAQVFKPNPEAYKYVADSQGVPYENCLMVTANKNFGDIEASEALGMQSFLIDRNANVGIDTLAELLEC